MTLADIALAAHDFTDERHSETMILNYVNEAISIVNSKIGLALTDLGPTGDYVCFKNDYWIRALFVPYASYGIKMNDGALEEAMVYLDTFERNLDNLSKRAHREVLGDFLGDKKAKIISVPFKQRWL